MSLTCHEVSSIFPFNISKRDPLDAGATLAARRFSRRLGAIARRRTLLLGATFPDINAVSAWVLSASGRSQNIP